MGSSSCDTRREADAWCEEGPVVADAERRVWRVDFSRRKQAIVCCVEVLEGVREVSERSSTQIGLRRWNGVEAVEVFGPGCENGPAVEENILAHGRLICVRKGK